MLVVSEVREVNLRRVGGTSVKEELGERRGQVRVHFRVDPFVEAHAVGSSDGVGTCTWTRSRSELDLDLI